jgi:hypothetical protein
MTTQRTPAGLDLSALAGARARDVPWWIRELVPELHLA